MYTVKEAMTTLDEFRGHRKFFKSFVENNQLDLDFYHYAKSLAFSRLLEEAIVTANMTSDGDIHRLKLHELLSKKAKVSSSSLPEKQKITFSTYLEPNKMNVTFRR